MTGKITIGIRGIKKADSNAVNGVPVARSPPNILKNGNNIHSPMIGRKRSSEVLLSNITTSVS
jgi:hypothetical protein